jgi:hypothetical protein
MRHGRAIGLIRLWRYRRWVAWGGTEQLIPCLALKAMNIVQMQAPDCSVPRRALTTRTDLKCPVIRHGGSIRLRRGPLKCAQEARTPERPITSWHIAALDSPCPHAGRLAVSVE